MTLPKRLVLGTLGLDMTSHFPRGSTTTLRSQVFDESFLAPSLDAICHSHPRGPTPTASTALASIGGARGRFGVTGSHLRRRTVAANLKEINAILTGL